MPTASFVYTTPVARSSISGVLLGSPVTVEIASGAATIPYSQRDVGGPIAGTDAKLVTTLTAADINSILAIIVARAQANGVAIPAGSMSVV